MMHFETPDLSSYHFPLLCSNATLHSPAFLSSKRLHSFTLFFCANGYTKPSISSSRPAAVMTILENEMKKILPSAGPEGGAEKGLVPFPFSGQREAHTS